MFNNRIPLYLGLSFAFAVACGKQPEEPEKVERIPINIATTLTRVTDSSYEAGDAIGLYVVNHTGDANLAHTGNHADNVRFTFSGSTWVADSPLYWLDGTTPADFYCYFPFRTPITDVNAVPVSVKADQRGNGYQESELLWGKAARVAPSPNPVEIVTRHVQSNLLLHIKPGNGFTEASLVENLTRVTIHSTRIQGILDLSSGAVTPTGDPSDITPVSTGDATYRAMMIPQTLEDASLISLEVGGVTYSLKQSITFVPNKQHSCTVTVNRTPDGIQVGIGSWVEDGTDYGGTING